MIQSNMHVLSTYYMLTISYLLSTNYRHEQFLIFVFYSVTEENLENIYQIL